MAHSGAHRQHRRTLVTLTYGAAWVGIGGPTIKKGLIGIGKSHRHRIARLEHVALAATVSRCEHHPELARLGPIRKGPTTGAPDFNVPLRHLVGIRSVKHHLSERLPQRPEY